MSDAARTEALLRLPEVCQRIGMSEKFVYRGVAAGTFPQPVQIGARAVAWLDSEVTAWIRSRPRAAYRPAQAGTSRDTAAA